MYFGITLQNCTISRHQDTNPKVSFWLETSPQQVPVPGMNVWNEQIYQPINFIISSHLSILLSTNQSNTQLNNETICNMAQQTICNNQTTSFQSAVRQWHNLQVYCSVPSFVGLMLMPRSSYSFGTGGRIVESCTSDAWMPSLQYETPSRGFTDLHIFGTFWDHLGVVKNALKIRWFIIFYNEIWWWYDGMENQQWTRTGQGRDMTW